MRTGIRDSLGAGLTGLLVVGFCFLLLWHNPLTFWKDDYEISILPVFADVARSWSEGHLPLLSPYSWVCSNLAGEYQYGTFSLFVNAAVVAIWKFPLTFAEQAAALSIVHLFVLAAGAFLLAREWNLRSPLAVMVGLIAALNGWIICWGATDWFGALGAFAWLPWAWWGMQRALDPKRSRWRFLWPAPFVYLVLTGGFPYTVLMLGLVGLWLILKTLGEERNLSRIWPLAAGSALGLGLAAPAWLALLDYVHRSARGDEAMNSAHWQWLVPPGGLPGFIWPVWISSWTDFSSRPVLRPAVELACGTLPPLVLLAALIFQPRRFVRQNGWLLGLLLTVLIISMLPSANVFRWSFRWLPLLHLVLALTAARALEGFWFWHRVDRSPVAFLPAALVFAALLASYLLLPTNVGLPQYPFPSSLTKPAPLDRSRLYLSVYPPPEVAYRVENHPGPVGIVTRPGSTSMWAGVHLINGYSPIRTAGVARAWAFSTHGEIDPGMAEFLVQWQAGPGQLLAIVGVDGIILASGTNYRPRPPNEWLLVHSSEEGSVYHRRAPLPPVRSVAAIDSLPGEEFAIATVEQRQDSRSSVSVDVSVPEGNRAALLLFSRPFFPGYEARIGNARLEVGSYSGLIPMVKVPAGTRGRLTMTYRPWWLTLGTAVAVSCAVLFLLSCLRALRARHQ